MAGARAKKKLPSGSEVPLFGFFREHLFVYVVEEEGEPRPDLG
jgi:hypothetical protein